MIMDKWTMYYTDQYTCTKNISPGAVRDLLAGIKHDHDITYKIKFQGGKSVREENLTNYVKLVKWNMEAQWVNIDPTKRPQNFGQYRVCLNRLGTDEEAEIEKAILGTVYKPYTGSLPIEDQGGMGEYVRKIFRDFVYSSVKLQIYTSTDAHKFESEKLAVQKINEVEVPDNTIVFGMHFSVVSGKPYLYWSIRYADNIAGLYDHILTGFWDKIGSYSWYDKYIVDNMYVVAETAYSVYKIGFDQALHFIDKCNQLLTSINIPESWYIGENSWMYPFVAGLIDAVIDEIKGIGQLTLMIVELSLESQRLIVDILYGVYEYAASPAYRAEINALVSDLSDCAGKMFAQAVSEMGEVGSQLLEGVENVYNNPQATIDKIVDNVRNLDSEDVRRADAYISGQMSKPFIWLGEKLGYYFGEGQTLAKKGYYGGYSIGLIASVIVGPEVLNTLGKGLKAIKGKTGLKTVLTDLKNFAKRPLVNFLSNYPAIRGKLSSVQSQLGTALYYKLERALKNAPADFLALLEKQPGLLDNLKGLDNLTDEAIIAKLTIRHSKLKDKLRAISQNLDLQVDNITDEFLESATTHIDIGGYNRYKNALKFTNTTQDYSGKPIQNLVVGRAESSLAVIKDGTVELITIESAPYNDAIITQVARALKLDGKLIIRSPASQTDVIAKHKAAAEKINSTFQTKTVFFPTTTAQGEVMEDYVETVVVKRGLSALIKVVLGSEELSLFAINFRKTLPIPNHKGNVAVFEYFDNSGNLVKKAFTTEVGIASHSEELAIDFFTTQNIPKANIKRIYSELEPCELAGHTCKAKLAENFPTAQKVFSYDYPGGVNNTIRAASVNQRYIDLEQLLK
jgi:hypothetical protein